MSLEEISRICDLAEHGKGVRTISVELGIPLSTVNYHVRHRGAVSYRNTYSPVAKPFDDDMTRLSLLGHSDREIGIILGLQTRTVKLRLLTLARREAIREARVEAGLEEA